MITVEEQGRESGWMKREKSYRARPLGERCGTDEIEQEQDHQGKRGSHRKGRLGSIGLPLGKRGKRGRM